MRIAIEYRLLCLGRELMARGIPRYTQQQLREVLALDGDNEYLLVCMEDADLSYILPEVLAAENVSLRRYLPPRELAPRWEDTGALLEIAEDFQAWLWRQGVDLYHSTTPFLKQVPLLTEFNACPIVTTFYDAIPFLFRKEFLTDDVYSRHYDRTLGLVRRATRVLAISEASASNAVTVGVPPGKVDIAYPMVDRLFRPLPDGYVDKLLMTLDAGVRIPERFLLTVTYPQYTKNMETLLEAYAGLPASLRRQYPLVIICPLTDHARHVVKTVAESRGISADLIMTGTVTDLQLAALYNRASLFVYPSRYEGFGMPIVEAMTCGTPVITTNVSSMPEAAGQAAVLVDAEDPAAFTDAIARLLADPVTAEALTAAGIEHARAFDGPRLGHATLASYRRAVADGASPPGPRVAVWSPLPPLQSGVADYTAELVGAMAGRADIELFVDDGYLPDDALVRDYSIQHRTAFARRQAQRPFDVAVYQMGASLFHAYIADALDAHPGIVAIHDLTWSQVLHAYWTTKEDMGSFHRELAASEGPAALAEFLAIDPQEHVKVSEFLSQHPMMERWLEPSLAQIVHDPVAAAELRAVHPGCDPQVVVMGVTDPYAGDAATSPLLGRSVLNRSPDGFLVGVYGIVHPYKRVEVAIEGFAGFAPTRPDARLLIVGRCHDPAYQAALEAIAERLGVAGKVEFAGRVLRPEFDAYLKAADVVINLRAPLTRSMSAVLMRALAAGRPVIMTDRPEWRFLPPSVCLRVPPGEAEAAGVAAALTRLGGDDGFRTTLGRAARAYYEREGTIQRMADRYLALIADVARTTGTRAAHQPELAAIP
ncbi:MAG TPA: glycosyltransferase [Actinomycetota bacterium]|nr:glycosyltransferase [Actinomycetota bacterium]